MVGAAARDKNNKQIGQGRHIPKGGRETAPQRDLTCGQFGPLESLALAPFGTTVPRNDAGLKFKAMTWGMT